MQLYTDQLIEDIQAAAKTLPHTPYYEVDERMRGIEYVLEWEHNPYQKMSEIFNLESIQFPPTNRLTITQIHQLTDEIIKLWGAYHFYANYPENLPKEQLYTLLVSWLDKKVQYISQVDTYIEFCEYEPESCTYGADYCWCKDNIFNDLDMNEYMERQYKEDDLPF